MMENLIRQRLTEHGRKLFDAPKDFIRFTKVEEADKLLNDVAQYPHAFVLGCVMDRQTKAEKAWLIPYKFKEKLGGFSMWKLLSLSPGDVRRLMKEPEPLHRFVEKMADFFFQP